MKMYLIYIWVKQFHIKLPKLNLEDILNQNQCAKYLSSSSRDFRGAMETNLSSPKVKQMLFQMELNTRMKLQYTNSLF